MKNKIIKTSICLLLGASLVACNASIKEAEAFLENATLESATEFLNNVTTIETSAVIESSVYGVSFNMSSFSQLDLTPGDYYAYTEIDYFGYTMTEAILNNNDGTYSYYYNGYVNETLTEEELLTSGYLDFDINDFYYGTYFTSIDDFIGDVTCYIRNNNLTIKSEFKNYEAESGVHYTGYENVVINNYGVILSSESEQEGDDLTYIYSTGTYSFDKELTKITVEELTSTIAYPAN